VPEFVDADAGEQADGRRRADQPRRRVGLERRGVERRWRDGVDEARVDRELPAAADEPRKHRQEYQKRDVDADGNTLYPRDGVGPHTGA
jgi:hypothetical protein